MKRFLPLLLCLSLCLPAQAQVVPSGTGTHTNGNLATCFPFALLPTEIAPCTGEVHLGLRVVTGAGAVTVATSDFVIVVNKASGAATTVNLPASPITGTTFYIKDGKGDASTNNITITPAAGNIDGAATYVMNVAFQAVELVYNGTQWNII